MNLGTLIQIIIALIFIYLICSLIISELQEYLAAWQEFRAKNLKQSLKIFLGENTTESLYNYSLFSSFNQYTNPKKSFNQDTNTKTRNSAGPSYIEPKILAESLIMLINKKLTDENKLLKSDPIGEFIGNKGTGIIGKIKSIEIKNSPELDKETIDTLIDIAYATKLKHDNATLEKFVDEIANTFTQIMERTSGVYKRNAKGVSLIFGFLAAALLNIDSFHIINELYKNPTLTQQINQIATTVIEKKDSCRKNAQDDPAKQKCEEIAMNEVKKVEGLTEPFPIGWNEKGWFNKTQLDAQNGFKQAIIGWFITGVAVAMGAPFWFNLLGKVINIRNTVNPISPKPKP